MIPVVLSALVAVFLMVLFLFLDYLGSRTRVEFLRDRSIFFSILVGAFVLSWLLFWSLLLCEDSFFFKPCCTRHYNCGSHWAVLVLS